jgi:ectoine hydroxylase-related dioxygenase (phytanoyl-CoA dioxygenase family)
MDEFRYQFISFLDPTSLMNSLIADVEFSKEKYPDKWKAVTLPAGGVVLLHGSLVHMSEKNSSQKSRHAYTFHVVDKHSLYAEHNWLHVSPSSPLALQYPNLPAHHNTGFRPFSLKYSDMAEEKK